MVSLSKTFRFFYEISRVFSTLTTISSNKTTSLVQCAQVCSLDLRCGGITWSALQEPRCGLVVDPSVAGSVQQPNFNVYRMENYQEEYMLRELLRPTSSWQETYSICSANQMKMVPVPQTLRDLATLSIRSVEWLNLDLQRRADGEYVDSSGTVLADSSVLVWGGKDNPSFGDEACIGVGYYPMRFYDQFCNKTTTYYGLCVEKVG